MDTPSPEPAEPFDAREALAKAVRAHDTAAVRRLVAEHPDAIGRTINDPLPRAPFGATPLLAALRKPDFELVDLLLGAGADINVKSQWWAGGFSVLDSADPTFARKLIERGARIEAPSAAKLGLFDDLKRLIAEDPSRVHARGGDGQTPLHVAATMEIAWFLVEHDADIDARDVDHESTPAQYLVRDKPDLVRYLIRRGCWTDILMAAALGDRALVERHLDADPACIWKSVSEEDFPKRDPRAGGTIYHWTLGTHKTAHLVAREFKHEDVLRLLMERSPDDLRIVMACELGDDGEAPPKPLPASTLSEKARRRLVLAAEMRNSGGVTRLLAAGWPVDARKPNGETALHWAAFHGDAALVRELLRHGAPANATEQTHGGTPLEWSGHGSQKFWDRERGDYAGVRAALSAAGAS